MQQPGFIGLLTAYYLGSDESDHANVMPPRVEPGDTILVHAGLYQGPAVRLRRVRPVDSCLRHAVRRHVLPDRGAAHPTSRSVIKAAGDGEVIFDGDGAQTLFNVMAADYNYFDGHHRPEHERRVPARA